jgi:hypothetical protein
VNAEELPYVVSLEIPKPMIAGLVVEKINMMQTKKFRCPEIEEHAYRNTLNRSQPLHRWQFEQ